MEGAQLRFLDLFLVWCLLRPSPALSEEELQRVRHNQNQVVLEGRRPGLKLQTGHGAQTLQSWGLALFDELAEVASLLDRAYGRDLYQQTLQAQRAKLLDPSQTLSGRLLDVLLDREMDNGHLGRQLAETYWQQLRGRNNFV